MYNLANWFIGVNVLAVALAQYLVLEELNPKKNRMKVFR